MSCSRDKGHGRRCGINDVPPDRKGSTRGNLAETSCTPAGDETENPTLFYQRSLILSRQRSRSILRQVISPTHAPASDVSPSPYPRPCSGDDRGGCRPA